jgi:uncharacterized protein YegP (UPF0339 family)
MAFFTYQDEQNRWNWRLKLEGKIIAVSGESYENQQDCIRAIERVKACAHAIVYSV